MIAKIFHPFTAKQAGAVYTAQPRDAEALPDLHTRNICPQHFDATDNLMPRSDRSEKRLQLTSSDVEISPANPAGLNPKQNLARSRVWNGQSFKMKRILLNRSRPMKHSGSHPSILTPEQQPHRLCKVST
jgi:hypothetical protein